MIPVPEPPEHLPQTQNRWQHEDCMPCVVCGREIRVAKAKYWVHLHDGGGSIVTEAEAETMSPAGDMGLYPIGPDCLKRNPQVKPYLAPPF